MAKPKTKPTNKILICLLFWDGDRAQALKLARLLADLEPDHSELADFLFVARFDCKHDPATVKHVSRKFNTFTHISKRRETGWPLGCNGLLFGTLEYAYHKMAAGSIPHYKAVLILGADSAPLKRGWLEHFHMAWDWANSKRKTYVAGALIPGNHQHINGDCLMLSGDMPFLKWLTLTASNMRQKAGWDWALANDFKRLGWEGFAFVKSIWQRLNPFTETDWANEVREGTVFFHGQKDDTLLDMARRKLLV